MLSCAKANAGDKYYHIEKIRLSFLPVWLQAGQGLKMDGIFKKIRKIRQKKFLSSGSQWVLKSAKNDDWVGKMKLREADREGYPAR